MVFDNPQRYLMVGRDILIYSPILEGKYEARKKVLIKEATNSRKKEIYICC